MDARLAELDGELLPANQETRKMYQAEWNKLQEWLLKEGLILTPDHLFLYDSSPLS